MESFKTVLKALGCAWIGVVVLIGLGGTWLTYNIDTVAEAGMTAAYDASGEADRRCQRAQEAYDVMWEDAVNSNRIDAMQDPLDRAAREAERNCASQ